MRHAISKAGSAIGTVFPFNWNVPRKVYLPESHGWGLGRYYIDWSTDLWMRGERWNFPPFDELGVTLTPSGRRYHPVRIAGYGLQRFADWLDNHDPAAERAYLAQAIWLRDHQAQRNGISGCYPYCLPNRPYGAEAGWLSAMAQGVAISLLLRAHNQHPSLGFLEATINAAHPFRFTLGEGGVTWRSAHEVIFEEVAVSPPSHILNGNIFALWGVWELAQQHQERWLTELASTAISTLRRRLDDYDSGYWSYYDTLASPGGFRRVAMLKYHHLHIAQLHVLAAMSGDPSFNEVAERWQSYTENYSTRLLVLGNTARGLIHRFISRRGTVPGGARTLIP